MKCNVPTKQISLLLGSRAAANPHGRLTRAPGLHAAAWALIYATPYGDGDTAVCR